MRNTTLSLLTATMVSLFALSGCGVQGDTLEEVRLALELPFGGYEDDETMPAFGLLDLDHAPVDPRIATPQRPDGIRAQATFDGEVEKGVLVARWHDLIRAHGLFVGKWADASGKLKGHFKGLYGKSKTHKGWVMFGKMVDPLGYPKGLLTGRFHSGLFQATWTDGDGAVLGMAEGLSQRRSLGEGEMTGHWERLAPPKRASVSAAAVVNTLLSRSM